jgi:hypothetical protein
MERCTFVFKRAVFFLNGGSQTPIFYLFREGGKLVSSSFDLRERWIT